MAQTEDFTIDQGADATIELHLQTKYGATKDLTDHSVAAKLKKTYNSDSADTVDFLATITEPPTDGIVAISLTNTQTDSLSAGRYVYDVELSFTDSDGNTIIERILEGKIDITPSVTK